MSGGGGRSFYGSVGPLLGLVLCLSLLYPLGMLIKGLVEERETRMRELMRISGMHTWPLVAAWWVTYLVIVRPRRRRRPGAAPRGRAGG